MTSAAYSNSMVCPSSWDAATAWNWAMISAIDGLHRCASACMGWQQESARFLEERITQDQRTWAALLASRDAADVVKAQQEWAVKAVIDYANESTRLTRLVTTLSLTGTTPAVQSAATLMM